MCILICTSDKMLRVKSSGWKASCMLDQLTDHKPASCANTVSCYHGTWCTELIHHLLLLGADQHFEETNYFFHEAAAKTPSVAQLIGKTGNKTRASQWLLRCENPNRNSTSKGINIKYLPKCPDIGLTVDSSFHVRFCESGHQFPYPKTELMGIWA